MFNSYLQREVSVNRVGFFMNCSICFQMMLKSAVQSFERRDLYQMDSAHPSNPSKKLCVRDIVFLSKNRIYPGGRNLKNTGLNPSLRNGDVSRM